jgi:hypothetical protein
MNKAFSAQASNESFRFGKLRKNKKLFNFVRFSKIVPDIDNSIYCPWLQAGDQRK